MADRLSAEELGEILAYFNIKTEDQKKAIEEARRKAERGKGGSGRSGRRGRRR